MIVHPPRLTLLALALSVGALAAPPQAPALTGLLAKRALQTQARFQELLAGNGFSRDIRPVLVRAQSDAAGRVTFRFQQTYRGVKVFGAQGLVHQDAAGRTQEALERFQRIGNLSVVPTLRAQEVLAVAQRHLGIREGDALSSAPELVIVPLERRIIKAASNPDGSLNARDIRHGVTGYALAYHVRLTMEGGRGGIRQRDVLVNAHSGDVLRDWDSLQRDAPAKGEGASEYVGKVILDTLAKADGSFDLVDTTRPSRPNPVTGLLGNATFNMDHAQPADATVVGPLYNDADDAWGDGRNYDLEEAPPTQGPTGQTAAVDAHYGLQVTWDMFKNVFGRDGIDDQGSSTFARVHFGQEYTNAFWSDACFCMTYGDGTLGGMNHGPMNVFTEIDVAGHEMSHGVTSHSAALLYQDEMGGLNESSSDILGKMVEFYALGAAGQGTALPDKGGRWVEGWGLDPSGAPLRFFYRPSLDGRSPDYWVPTLGNLDVHYSSGPSNRMFYFLSVGSDPDPEALGFSRFLPKGMKGLGNQHAAQIWYRALTHYMTPTTRYFDARKACVQAATDLYGEMSPEYQAVQNAFGAINVGATADGRKEDLQPPVVQGVSVQGTTGAIVFGIRASDDQGLASVDYFVDGNYAGTSTDPGFRMPFDSSSVSNDAHVLTAIAYDTNQNVSTLSDPVTFTVHNARFNGIEDGSFEWQAKDWFVVDGLPDSPLLGTYGHSGSYSISMGANYDVAQKRYLPFHAGFYQDLKLPSDCETLTLGYWFLAGQPDFGTPPPTDGIAHDQLTLQVLDAQGAVLRTVGSASNLDDVSDPMDPVWTNRTVDLSDLKGQDVRLQVEATNDDQGFGTVFILDDFSLQGTARSQTLATDLNADGQVDGYDLALLMAAFDPTRTPSDPRADLNGDGLVDDKDLDLLLADFGK